MDQSRAELFHQSIISKLFFNQKDLATQTGNPEMWGGKHLQVKPEEIHVVNANSLQPWGT